MEKIRLKLGGVPEHFNLPIHLAIENGMFSSRGLDIEWVTFPGGTGQMTKALRDGDVDACILLTEGVIADIIRGNPSKILSEYVSTPLTWGIHTDSKNPLDRYQDIFDKQYAISRFGSGSHLMAIVDADSKGRKLSKGQFTTVGDLDGAIASLENFDTDVFYWEKYTTKPLVDCGQFKRLGEYNTPWPSFVVAGTDGVLEKHPTGIIRMLRTIHDSCDMFMHDKDAVNMVSERFKQKIEDVERWYHSTEWAIHGWVSDKMMKSVIFHLLAADIIDKQADESELIWVRNKTLDS